MKPVIFLDHTIKLCAQQGHGVAFYIFRRGKRIERAAGMPEAKQRIRELVNGVTRRIAK